MKKGFFLLVTLGVLGFAALGLSQSKPAPSLQAQLAELRGQVQALQARVAQLERARLPAPIVQTLPALPPGALRPGLTPFASPYAVPATPAPRPDYRLHLMPVETQ